MVNRIFASFYWNCIDSFRPICSYLRLHSVPVPQQMSFFRRYFWQRSASYAAAALLLAFAVGFQSNVAFAASGTWTLLPGNGNASGNWSLSSNWSGGTIADGATFTADFST